MRGRGPALWAIVVVTGLGGTTALGAEEPMAKDIRKAKVSLPQRLMLATEVLDEISMQTGMPYAYPTGALVRQIDATAFDGSAAVGDVAGKLAPALRIVRGTLLLEQPLDAAALEALTNRLASKTPAERCVAAYELGCTKSTRAIPPLLRALDDKDERVRHHALRSLDRLERDFPDYHPAGRVSVFGLVKIQPTRVVRCLTGALDPTTHEWVWSARLLARMPSRAAEAHLRKAADHHYPPTRRAALAALKALLPPPARTAVPDAPRRRDSASTADLLRRLGKEKNAETRAERLLALGRAGGKDAWDQLLKAAGDKDPVIYRAAIRALDRCPDPRAVPVLMHWLTGDGVDGYDRNLAGMSLGMIGTPEVVAALSTYVDKRVASGGVPISTTALALGWTHDPAAVPALVKCLPKGRGAAALKAYAFTSLARIGTRPAVEALLTHYNQYDNTARYCGHAGVRLAGAWHQTAVDRYVESVKAGRGRIAPHGLEMAEDPRAVDALVEQLPKSRGDRLHFIVQALGRSGDPAAVPALLKALNHSTDWVRHEAARALRWRWYWHRPEVQRAFAKHPVFKAFVAEPPSIEQQPANTWVLRKWPIDFDDYRACNTSYEAGLVYDDATGKIVKWGSHGQRCDTPQTGETWTYDPATNTWQRSKAPVEPFGMCGTWGLAYDRANEKTVSVQLEGGNHGWQWDRGRALRASVPWLYDGEKDRWIPVRPPKNPGQRGFLPLAYIDRHQVTMLYGGQGRAIYGKEDVCLYDAFANTWHYLKQQAPNPGVRNHHGLVYLPERDEVLMFGGSRGGNNVTWLYDVKTNAWRDAKAGGKPPLMRHTIKYDPLTGTVLGFRFDSGRPTVIWQYDPGKNAWKPIPTPPEPTPHYHSVDVAYDPVHNVWVLDGGHVNWNTDHIGVREVWTYRLKKRDGKDDRLPAPASVDVNTKTGACVLTWKPVTGAAGYVVYRGTGSKPWKVAFKKVTSVPVKTTTFAHPTKPTTTNVAFYYVAAVDAPGAEGRPSIKVRPQPPWPREAVASVRPDRTVSLTWSKVDRPDIVGYYVYAGSIKVGARLHMTSMETFTAFKRLTAKPVTKTTFHDTAPLAEAAGLFNHEVRTYQVTTVNALGIESGPSPLALTLTSSVPGVTATERTDGSTLIAWQPVPEQPIRGYAVYRMDDVRGTLCIRLNPVPVTGTTYVDRCEAPRAERRRYYVVAIDALNNEGLPSTGAWAFGRP